jgi:putative membrane protein insertion efficiency factor
VNLIQQTLIFAVRVYRLTLSPAQAFLFGRTEGCRFTPTCSQYALEALHRHGAVTGTVLTAKRICRCHPWGGCGHDPVPKAEQAPGVGHSISI